ncbi:MAG: hypothetical protein V1904_14370 [Bacteroidota bacterium]
MYFGLPCLPAGRKPTIYKGFINPAINGGVIAKPTIYKDFSPEIEKVSIVLKNETADFLLWINDHYFVYLYLTDSNEMQLLTIRNELFWDIKSPDEYKNQRLIIERVSCLGNLDEFIELINFYGKENVINELKQIGSLDPKTFQFVVSFFKIAKNQMKCYIKKPSRPKHWH